jgi:hypothetical protein
MDPRVVRIFLSTPSDIVDERRAFVALVAEVNDVVSFLAPERNVQLKALQYQTDVYPDIVGSAQEAVDKQIPETYDIHLGIMWKRAGTPTSGYPSGTIHEFEHARETREKTGKPIIMFYFCEQAIPVPRTLEEIDQLKTVVEFRERVQTMGLTGAYSTTIEFRERVRIMLLRAVADILKQQPAQQTLEAAAAPATTALPEQLEQLCVAYDRIRGSMKPGPTRTRAMTEIVEFMRSQAPSARGSLAFLKGRSSGGHRLAAVVILQVFPSQEDLGWLADRLNPAFETPFMGFQAASALLQAVRSLPRSDYQVLHDALTKALQLAELNQNDPPRITTLKYAIEELEKAKTTASGP